MAKKRRKKKGTTSSRAIIFDFRGVTSGGRKRIPVGEYPFKVEEVSEDEGDAGPYWKVVSTVTSGKQEGFKDWTNYSHSKKALWKLRGFLEACGIEIPEGKKKIRPRDLVDLEFGAAVEDDTFEGKTRSRIADVFPLDELEETDEEETDDDEEEDEEETDEEEDEEDDDDEVVDDDDEEEEEEEDEEEETPTARKRRRQKERRVARKKRGKK